MTFPRTRVRSLGVVVVATVLLSGASLLGASAASADVALPFTITSPTPNQTVQTGAVDITGTGASGDRVTIEIPGVQTTPAEPSATVQPDGTWDVPLSVGTDAVGFHQIVASGTLDSAGIYVTFEQPASPALAVTSPTSGSTVPSREVTFRGTAPAGSTVSADSAGLGTYQPDVVVGDSGAWSFTIRFSVESLNALLSRASVTFGGQDPSGAPFVPRTVSDLALPAPSATPVVVSPAAGTTIPSTTVTVSGTATGGPAVSVFFSPVDAAARTAANTLPEGRFESTGVLDADGNWTATTTLAPGTWAAVATLIADDDVHSSAGFPLSLPSAPRQFVLTAAPASAPAPAPAPSPGPTSASGPAPIVPTTPAGDPTGTGVAAAGELAFTGSSPATPLLGGALLLVAGLALVILRRRRRLG